MIDLKDEGLILAPTSLDFEFKGVFNPATIRVGDEIQMFYRAVSYSDISSIGFCRFDMNNKIIERLDRPLIAPEFSYERMGCEDPRVTYIDDKYYLFYTAYDGINAQIAYAVADKLPHFEKKGFIMPKFTYEEVGKMLKSTDLSLRYKAFEEKYQTSRGEDVLIWEKDAVLFPKKIAGKFALLHRVLPGIQMVLFENFEELSTKEFWVDHFKNLDDFVLIEPSLWYDSWNVGGGCPPLKTKYGWLLIYHAVEYSSKGRVYHAAAALLDEKDPRKVIAKLPEPLFSPSYTYETNGIVDNVVFPTGLILNEKKLTIYYGGADRVVAAKSVDLDLLLEELIKSSKIYIAPSTG